MRAKLKVMVRQCPWPAAVAEVSFARVWKAFFKDSSRASFFFLKGNFTQDIIRFQCALKQHTVLVLQNNVKCGLGVPFVFFFSFTRFVHAQELRVQALEAEVRSCSGQDSYQRHGDLDECCPPKTCSATQLTVVQKFRGAVFPSVKFKLSWLTCSVFGSTHFYS